MTIGVETHLLLALAALAPLTIPPASAQPRPDRVETVAGWRISSGGSGDGGYVARLSRRTRTYNFNHEIEYWRGNGGLPTLDEFRRGRCVSAGENTMVPYAVGTSRRRLDRQLAAYLRECPLPRAEAAALHRSLDRAWPVFMRHARRQRAAMDAEIARMMRGG